MSEATVSVDDLRKSLEEAQAKVTAAEADQAAKGPALFKAGDYDGLAALNAPVKAAKAEVARIERSIENATRESRWAAFETERAPVQDTLNDLIKAAPTAPVIGVKGRILIDTVEEKDGDAIVQVRRAHVTLTPIVEKIDLDAFEEAIAANIDVAKWDAAGIADVTISISDIGGESKLAISPTASLNAAGKSTGEGNATRAGAMEYSFNGQWLGSRALLEALESAGHPIATDRANAFDVALREPSERKEGSNKTSPKGNALSNTANAVAKALNLEKRANPSAE